MTKRLYKYGTALALLLSLCATAQPPVEARLDSVPRDGFYRVVLTPVLSRFARTDLADVRIRDSRNEPVPYRLERSLGHSTFSWLQYPIAALRQEAGRTSITFQVPEPKSSGFMLNVRNSAARRGAQLTGSNDGRTWYSLRDSFLVEPAPDASGIAALQLTYPVNSYRYIRLDLNNGKDAPLEPLYAGRPMGEPRPENWNGGQRLSFEQSGDSGTTRILLHNPDRWPLEKLGFAISRPRFFARNCSIRDARDGHVLASGVLTSNQRELLLEPTRASLLEIIIENGDNPRLQVDSILGSQRRYLLAAYLERGQQYRISAGDSNAAAPRYDLSGFSNAAIDTAREISIGAVRLLPAARATGKNDQRTWIWIALCIGILVLGAASFSLLRDVKRGTAGGAD
ncbi:hypothetical protein [Flaviaesturariibacter terrae]